MKIFRVFALGLLSIAIAVSASADVISTSGITVVTPPAGTNITTNFQINGGLPAQIIFNEAQGVTLSGALLTDSGTIAAGTIVDSHFFALNSNTSLVGDTSATFDGAVLGVIYLDGSGNYISSDFLGLSGLTYNEACFNCGFEGGDTATISGNTVFFHNSYDQPGDFARVITLAAPVTTTPEPASLALLGTGLICAGGAVRRKLLR